MKLSLATFHLQSSQPAYAGSPLTTALHAKRGATPVLNATDIAAVRANKAGLASNIKRGNVEVALHQDDIGSSPFFLTILFG